MTKQFITGLIVLSASAMASSAGACGLHTATAGFDISSENCVTVYRGRPLSLDYDAIAKMELVDIAQDAVDAKRAHYSKLEQEARRQTAQIEAQTAYLASRQTYYSRPAYTGRYISGSYGYGYYGRGYGYGYGGGHGGGYGGGHGGGHHDGYARPGDGHHGNYHHPRDRQPNDAPRRPDLLTSYHSGGHGGGHGGGKHGGGHHG